ncbi:hypothetical protein FA13DRAFT_1818604 [Coprinellus micaceus]|uniref:Uncharacterized protein n=1 Tax=Coprinellus micaceus TaxID=71717 RepID=A0A4Y7SN39_COPMI|nr:hypothetical protein FA13DRAFT_1818604 [Coprinellus micaceus]
MFERAYHIWTKKPLNHHPTSTYATAAVSPPPASDPLLAQWRGLNDDEATQFVNDAIEILSDSAMVAEFGKNVGEVGNWANEVDEAFDPRDEDLRSSRFEKVFLDMVLHIQTEQDRLDVIVELEEFINEDHDTSDQMSRTFLELKRDIDAFSARIDRYLEETGTQLDAAQRHFNQSFRVLRTRSRLDKQINDTRIALAVSGGLLNVIGLIVAGSMLASYQNQRDAKNKELEGKLRELADINRRQQALALQGFAEIWASVRSQSIQFRDHIKGGLGAATNLRFKREVQLAQDTCLPLRTGLEIYAHNLGGRLASKGYEIKDTT